VGLGWTRDGFLDRGGKFGLYNGASQPFNIEDIMDIIIYEQ
jgi:hypothetical protein